MSVPTIPHSKPETPVDPITKRYERIQTTCVFMILLGILLLLLAVYVVQGAIIGGVMMLISAPLMAFGLIGTKIAGFMAKYHNK